MVRESLFQRKVIEEIEEMLPGCVVLKNDPGYRQGIPDIIVLYRKRWAMLEFKRSNKSPRQPNQEHYVDEFRKMSYAAFIYPENKEQVLDELQYALLTHRNTRVPKR